VSSQALNECIAGQRVQLIGTLVMHQAPPTAKRFEFLISMMSLARPM
jgi:hypothetical protein